MKIENEVRVVSETGGEKGSKPVRIDLIPPDALAEVGKVYNFGASKYAAHNYRRGYDFSLSIAALYRHVNAFNAGEDLDPESGLPHLAHAAFHCFAVLQIQKDYGDQFDDRYKGV